MKSRGSHFDFSELINFFNSNISELHTFENIILCFQFGGVVPYIPQYLMIKRSQSAEGFSNYVCLTLLIANILRIEFWFGKHFETPLLIQSIVMIICMITMLELCVRIHSKSRYHHLPMNQQNLPNLKDSSLDTYDKIFTDFQMEYFWNWTA